jgi:hypothetical protein
MYFSQRSPTTYRQISMRGAPSLVGEMWYLAAREAPDRDDHSGVVGLLSVCDKIWRLEYSCTVSDEVRIWSVVLLEARDVKESCGRANH